MPAGSHLRLSDQPADPHRRGPRRDGEVRRPARRVPERRIRVRRHVGGHRRFRRRRPHLHRDRLAGPAVHGRSGLQRLRPRPADRDDGRQSGHRRADQHLERSQRLDQPARLRLDPAVRRNQPGSDGPAHPGLQAGRRVLAAGDGVHGRLHPDPRLRASRRADAGAGRRVPAAVPAAPGPRPGRPGLDRCHGRPGSLHRGALPRPLQAAAGPRLHPGAGRRVQGGLRPRSRRPGPPVPHGRRRDRGDRTRLGARHDQGRGGRDAGQGPRRSACSASPRSGRSRSTRSAKR